VTAMHPTTTCTVTNASLLHCNTALSQLSGRCRHRPSASATSTPTRSTTQPLCNEPSVTPSRAVSCHDTLAMHMRLDLSGQAEALATCTMNMTYHPNRSTTNHAKASQSAASMQARQVSGGHYKPQETQPWGQGHTIPRLGQHNQET
jgi:hypothetical protein